MPIRLTPVLAVLLAAPLSAATPATPPAPLADAEHALAALNEAQLRAYALERDGASIDRTAHSDFKAIIAPGLIENRQIVRDGAAHLDFERFDVTTRSVDIVGDSAVVVTTIAASGAVQGRPFPARLAMMHFYTRVEGEWRLLGRSSTPIQVPPEAYERLVAPALARAD